MELLLSAACSRFGREEQKQLGLDLWTGATPLLLLQLLEL